MSTTEFRTLDQDRAKHAWSQLDKLPESKQKDFGTLAKKLPTQIMSAGLGQAMAFLDAKSASELSEAVADWIQQRLPASGDKRLITRIINGDADFLRFATAESLAYLTWLVRFADARGFTDEVEG